LFRAAVQNAMHDSLTLFDSICNHPSFTSTPTILFLNKKDIFLTRIQHIPLAFCFADYKGRRFLFVLMYKTAVYTLVNGVVTHRKQQMSNNIA